MKFKRLPARWIPKRRSSNSNLARFDFQHTPTHVYVYIYLIMYGWYNTYILTRFDFYTFRKTYVH